MKYSLVTLVALMGISNLGAMQNPDRSLNHTVEQTTDTLLSALTAANMLNKCVNIDQLMSALKSGSVHEILKCLNAEQIRKMSTYELAYYLAKVLRKPEAEVTALAKVFKHINFTTGALSPDAAKELSENEQVQLATLISSITRTDRVFALDKVKQVLHAPASRSNWTSWIRSCSPETLQFLRGTIIGGVLVSSLWNLSSAVCGSCVDALTPTGGKAALMVGGNLIAGIVALYFLRNPEPTQKELIIDAVADAGSNGLIEAVAKREPALALVLASLLPHISPVPVNPVAGATSAAQAFAQRTQQGHQWVPQPAVHESQQNPSVAFYENLSDQQKALIEPSQKTALYNNIRLITTYKSVLDSLTDAQYQLLSVLLDKHAPDLAKPEVEEFLGQLTEDHAKHISNTGKILMAKFIPELLANERDFIQALLVDQNKKLYTDFTRLVLHIN